MIAYRDGGSAMDWLSKAFGFDEQTRWMDDDGVLAHGEMVAGHGLIMLATPSPEYEGPRQHRDHCVAAAGATLLSGIEEGPDGRLYRAEDLEGHRWMFVERRA